MMSARILWFVVGVGVGNTTRTLAVLREMKRRHPDVEVHLAAQGKARTLLSEYHPVHALEDVSYTSDGGTFSGWSIIRSNLGFPKRFLENRAHASRLIHQLKPTLVVADSDFYCLGPARAAGVSIATINNSPAIRDCLSRWGVPAGCGFSGNVIERVDAALQSHYADHVIAPMLRRQRGLAAKVVQVPPIVREDFRPAADVGNSVVVVTGGSGIGTADIDLRCVEAPLETYGAELKLVPPGTVQHGFSLGVADAMARARVLVVQGGFSSVSEAVALRRPAVVLPITGQAEQWVNGRVFESLGFGLSVASPRAGEAVARVLANLGDFETRIRKSHVRTDGARVVARRLSELASP